MYNEKMNGNIDWKRQTFHVYHEDGTAQQIHIDEEGNVILEVEMFKAVILGGNLKRFIDALSEILSKDQLESVLTLWGTANAIKTSTVAAILEGDKILTKKVIAIGLLRKIITGGVNSTYKIINKEEQKTMREHADRMGKGEMIAESLTETHDRMKREGKLEKEEEVIEPEVIEEQPKKCITRYVRPENKTVAPSISKAVHIIAEKKDYGSMSEVHLRKELDALQYELEVDKWGENRTPWHVHDEIKLVKAQLIGFDNRKNAEKYKQEVNSINNSKSIMRLPDTKEKVKGSQTLPKKKSVQAPTPVLKKRS